MISFSLAGGSDKDKFILNSATGILDFISAPDYEYPSDADEDNVYEVSVSASDGKLSDTQLILVKVENVNEPPVITSDGGGDLATVAAAENQRVVTTVRADDPDWANQAKTGYRLLGTGYNEWGQLGDGANANRSTFGEIVGEGVIDVAVGQDYTLFVKADGSLWAMGANEHGQLGDGATDNRSVPVKVVDADVIVVATGRWHSLFIKTDGSLWGFGNNWFSQLGDGTWSNDRLNPIRIVESGVYAVAAGEFHSVFLKTDGSLWGMGLNRRRDSGYLEGLGIEPLDDFKIPTKIIDANVTAISAGSDHTLFTKTDGSLWGFGTNSNGRLGDESIEDQTPPVEIVESGVKAIASGGGHTLFIKEDGSLWGMGYNGGGTLGLGDSNDRTSPVMIVSTGVDSVSGFEGHSLFIKEDGSLWGM